ncbi:MAG: hypothetical protein RLY11_1321 [Bacteroidota bacterium]|jgi:hypothetical protein
MATVYYRDTSLAILCDDPTMVDNYRFTKVPLKTALKMQELFNTGNRSTLSLYLLLLTEPGCATTVWTEEKQSIFEEVFKM